MSLSKLTRRVKRNHDRAIKARSKREKEMQQLAFTRGLSLGADMQKARTLNATAGMEYEEPQTVVGEAGLVLGGSDSAQCSNPESDSVPSVPPGEVLYDFIPTGAITGRHINPAAEVPA